MLTVSRAFEPGAGEAALVEDLEGGVQDLSRAFLGEATPPRAAAACGARRVRCGGVRAFESGAHRMVEITDWSVT